MLQATTPHEECREKILSLQGIMIAETPKLPVVLGEIKRILLKNPEVATLLTEEEIGKLVAGLSARAGEKLAEAVVKSTRAKSIKGATVDDL
jgi:hypothetical protein